jgi:hypothetical protein
MIKYTHYKNKNLYHIIGMCLIQENGEWCDAILYKEVGGTLTFVRSEKEFESKFKIVEDE